MAPHRAAERELGVNVPDKVARAGLNRNCLSYSEVLAQSISVIAPSTVPAAILGLIFASAGNATWLSFLLGMVGMVLVSLNINQFARRSASPASLYSFIVMGLGPTAGVLGGWALLFAYIMTGMSTLCGFAIFVNVLLSPLGISVPVLVSFGFGALATCYVACRDIRFSAKTMLWIEGSVLVFILILGLTIWWNKGFAIDTAQLRLEGATPSGVMMGVLLVVFAFSGFESSTSLGHEAKDPLNTIPRSVLQSVLISGLFFIVMAYIVVVGFHGSGLELAKTEAPLDVLANANGLGLFSTFINVGILLSFFACTLACVNATARIVFSMSRHGLAAEVFGDAHESNKTPHVAVMSATLVTFLLPTTLYLFGVSAFDGQGYFGTLCSFGFLLVYILVSLAAPRYLHSIGQLSRSAVAVAALSIAFMFLPVLGTLGFPGSTTFPPPEYPENVMLILFAIYMVAGFSWMTLHKKRSPHLFADLRNAIDSLEFKLAEASAPANAALKTRK